MIIVSNYEPYPLTMGSCQRIRQMSSFLRREYRVGLAVNQLSLLYEEELRAVYDDVWFLNSPEFPRHHGNSFAGLWGRVESFIGRRRHESLVKSCADLVSATQDWRQIEFFARIFRRTRPVAVIAEYVWAAVPALPVATRHGIRAIIDTHDVMARRTASQLAAGVPPSSELSPEVELQLLRTADAVLAIQSEERDHLRGLLPDTRVILAEHPVPAIAPIENRSEVVGPILFVGSQARHNVDALATFIEKQWPLVLAANPGTRLRVVGRVGDELPEQMRGVRGVDLAGVVDDLAAEYANASLVINPARYGSGLKIKSVEALAHGKLLVSTSVGVEGLSEEGAAFVKVSLAEMGRTVADLLKDQTRRARHERAALDYARRRFSPEGCFAELLGYLRSIT